MIIINKETDSYLAVTLNLAEANLENSEGFKNELIGMFDQYRKRIVINMEMVEYIDSSFLGALVASLKYVIASQSDIILVDMRKDIADLFSLIRLDKVFKVYASYDQFVNEQ